MRSFWIVLVASSVLVVTACFRNTSEEPVSTVFPKGYARPVALGKGDWKNGYNFALGEALQQADREAVTEEPAVTPNVIPYAPGKAPSAVAKAPTKSEPVLTKVVAKSGKKLRGIVAKLTKKAKPSNRNDVMLSAAGR